MREAWLRFSAFDVRNAYLVLFCVALLLHARVPALSVARFVALLDVRFVVLLVVRFALWFAE